MTMAYPGVRKARQSALAMPPGVVLIPLESHVDDRGDFTEIHRATWYPGPPPAQWNLIRSHANSLRGVHAHRLHQDIVIVLSGELILGLQDLRPQRPEDGIAVTLRLPFEEPSAVTIPPRVAHSFAFTEPTTMLIGVSREFDGADEFGCHWTDAGLRLEQPVADPQLSARDRDAGSLAALIRSLHA
jgi:dTDP-4-dehydrorhamnose 3,5-epimerase